MFAVLGFAREEGAVLRKGWRWFHRETVAAISKRSAVVIAMTVVLSGLSVFAATIVLGIAGGITVLTIVVMGSLLLEAERTNRRVLAAVSQVGQRLVVEAQLNGGSIWGGETTFSARPDYLAKLADIVCLEEPARIVELGAGVSTMLLARLFEGGVPGSLVSIESDVGYADLVRRRLLSTGAHDRVNIVVAPLKPVEISGRAVVWYDPVVVLATVGEIDLLLIDGPSAALDPEIRATAAEVLFERLSDGALVILDDADRPGEQRVLRRWLRQYGTQFEYSFPESERGIAVLRRVAPSAVVAR
jgi:predicted O-methyltransferase YrrM